MIRIQRNRHAVTFIKILVPVILFNALEHLPLNLNQILEIQTKVFPALYGSFKSYQVSLFRFIDMNSFQSDLRRLFCIHRTV